MNALFTQFYAAILSGSEPPIPYRDIRRITAIMDAIFQRCGNSDGVPGIPEPAPETSRRRGGRTMNIFMTGGNGFPLGKPPRPPLD